MPCPHYQCSSTSAQESRTAQGFRRFRCRDCKRRFNERTGTVLNRVQMPTATDGHTSYPTAITEELGTDVDHRTSQYKNNVLEQDHRGVKDSMTV